MTTKNESQMLGFDRVNALMTWWGGPNLQGAGNMETQMKRLQDFVADLQKNYGDAYSQQVNALVTANERLAQSLQELMRCRQPQDLVAAESKILATLFEGASGQAKTWIELTEKIQNSCAAMARDTAEGVGKPADQAAEAKLPVVSERHASGRAAREPAHA